MRVRTTILIKKQLFALLFLLGLGAYAQAPGITSFSPTVITHRTTVAINGTGFTTAMAYTTNPNGSVKFNGTNATSVTYVSPTLIRAIVPAGVTSGTISVTAGGNTATSSSTYTYVTPANTPSTAVVSRIVTDYNGYWSSTTASPSNVLPDNMHSIKAFQYNGTLYSTGTEADVTNTLTTGGLTSGNGTMSGQYTPGNFRALPINDIEGTVPTATSNPNLIVLGSLVDGSSTTQVPTAPTVAGLSVRDVLIDGVRGLNIGSGVTNLPSTSVLTFEATNIISGTAGDAIPDVVVSQIATPSTDYSVYCFIDASGNIVGTPVRVQFTSINKLATYKSDFFTLQAGMPLNSATVNGSTIIGANTRDIRMVAYKLSDFGINETNKSQVARFKVMPSGTSDPAFMAYNRNSFQIPSPEIASQPTSKALCPGSSTTFSVSVTATGTELTYQWEKNGMPLSNGGNISGVNTATLTINPVTEADAGVYRCLITNPSGSALSDNAYLNSVIISTTDATTCANTPTTIEVGAQGNTPVYQWYNNGTTNSNVGGTPISGATSSTYSPPVSVSGTRYYYAEVYPSGYPCAKVTSGPVAVNVTSAAVIGDVSENQSICSGGSATVSVSDYTGTIQWESSTNGSTFTTISGATNASYLATNITQTTYFRAVASGSCGSATSSTVTITVNEEFIWTGAVSTEWNNPGNWSCNIIPTLMHDVYIPAAPEFQPIVTTTTGYGKSLYVESGATVTVNSGLTLHIASSISVASGGTVAVKNNAALLQEYDVENIGNITYTKLSNPLFRLDYTFWSSPVTGQNLKSFSPLTLATAPNYRFYTYGYDAAQEEDAYITVNPNTNDFVEGTGYLIRMPNQLSENTSVPNFLAYNAGTYSFQYEGKFTGKANNGPVSIIASQQGQRINGIGNPYPSPISVQDFFLSNENVLSNGSTSDGIADAPAIYFWRKKNNAAITSYATLTLAGFTANGGAPDTGGATDPSYQYGGQDMAGYYTGDSANWTIAAGQGFFVQTSSAPVVNNITFDNDMRRATPGASQSFFRSGNVAPISRLWLNLTDEQNNFNQIAIAYKEGATLGLDYGYDGKRFATEGGIALYSVVGQAELAIQARPAFEDTDVVPVGYTAQNGGNFIITLDHVDGLFEGDQDIYLSDKLTGTLHNLKTGAYNFASEAGTFNNRFDVVYVSTTSLGLNDNVFNANNVIVYKQGNDIAIDAGAATMSYVNIYDINGRLIYNATDINAAKTVLTNIKAQEQLIILEIGTDKGKVSKKVIF